MRPYALFLLVAVAGCTTSKPGSSDGEKALAARLDGGASTRLRLTSFKKTDGQSSEINGVKHYAMKFDAVATLSENAYYIGPGSIFDVLDANTTVSTYPASAEHPGCPNDQPCILMHPSPLRGIKGDQFTLDGVIAFQRSEAGWSPTAVKFTSQRSCTNQPMSGGVRRMAKPDCNDGSRGQYVAEMQYELGRLLYGQEGYYGSRTKYTTSPADLAYQPTYSVSPPIINVGPGWWNATVTHPQAPGTTCTLAVNSTNPLNEHAGDGEAWCQ